LPDPAILLRPSANREAVLSSRLEGTHASPKELLLFELNPREAKSAEDRLNDHREVFNYQLALRHGVESDLPLSLRLIRELHEILLKQSTPSSTAMGV
jgi:Fic family protein